MTWMLFSLYVLVDLAVVFVYRSFLSIGHPLNSPSTLNFENGLCVGDFRLALLFFSECDFGLI